MDKINNQELTRINELLERSSDFIAYFELAESKIMEWREDITQQAASHSEHLQGLKQELETIKEFFSRAGIEQFNEAAENTMSQGNDYLQSLKHTEQALLRQIHDHRAELTRISQHAISDITHHANKTLGTIHEKLSHYDVEHFDTVANRSCEKVEHSTQTILQKSNTLLKIFQWKALSLTLATTLITAFAVSFYVSDEYPWEMHQQATNERGAGKILLNAWPELSQSEKNKILNHRLS